jgi:hypothetical protein
MNNFFYMSGEGEDGETVIPGLRLLKNLSVGKKTA